MDVSIQHSLSILNFNKFMNVEKYKNQILYESIFMAQYKTLSEYIFYSMRLTRRALVLFLRVGNFSYTHATFKMILKLYYVKKLHGKFEAKKYDLDDL